MTESDDRKRESQAVICMYSVCICRERKWCGKRLNLAIIVISSAAFLRERKRRIV